MKNPFAAWLIAALSAMLLACTPAAKPTQPTIHQDWPTMQTASASQSIGKTHSKSKNHSTDKTPATSQSSATDASLLAATFTRGSLPEQRLQREGYVCSYNRDTRIPNWCAWCLTRQHAAGKEKRGGIDFQPDEDVPEPRADTYDYMRSGYDRGHICPAGDNKWSHKAIEQTFLLSNICPQNPELNRGDWNEIEQSCRQWAKRYGRIYIIAGPVFLNQRHRRIGKHKVAVPEAFFKVVLCLEGDPKAIGFICRNTDGNRQKDAYVNSLAQVERITGYRFFPTLPAKVRRQVESQANIEDW